MARTSGTCQSNDLRGCSRKTGTRWRRHARINRREVRTAADPASVLACSAQDWPGNPQRCLGLREDEGPAVDQVEHDGLNQRPTRAPLRIQPQRASHTAAFVASPN